MNLAAFETPGPSQTHPILFSFVLLLTGAIRFVNCEMLITAGLVIAVDSRRIY